MFDLITLSRTLSRPQIKGSSVIREIFNLFMLIGAIYALVNLATVRFIVQGPSMQPTFHDNQYLIVSRVNYMLHELEQGDIVVFHFPDNERQDYIKRVIGLPGDTIEIRDTLVYINGEIIEEPYINEPCSEGYCRDDIWTLNAYEYFVMGDNRNRSRDSRDFGPVSRKYIVGEVFLRYWPPNDWDIVSQLNYSGD